VKNSVSIHHLSIHSFIHSSKGTTTMAQSTETIYRVVISDEGRYAIWPEYKEIPWGWQADKISGPKQICLDYIAQIWTDMQPLSLQKVMDRRPDQRPPKQSEPQTTRD